MFDQSTLIFSMIVALSIIVIIGWIFLFKIIRFMEMIQKDQGLMVQDLIEIKSVIENHINVLNHGPFIQNKDDIEILTDSVILHPDGSQSVSGMILKDY